MELIIKKYLGDDISQAIEKISIDKRNNVQEIRLRADKPLSVVINARTSFVDENGTLSECSQSSKKISKERIGEIFSKMCHYSVHSYASQIKNGYVTLEGGHRVGIGGKYLSNEKTSFDINEITSLNIRIAKEIKGCSDEICKEIFKNGLVGTLILGAPSSGKTTILRDISRQLSSGNMGRLYKIAVVDSRNEISGFEDENICFDIGSCSDVLSGCSKSDGVLKAIRVLSPDAIICDEMGTQEEVETIITSLNSGVKVITSAHASSKEEIFNKRQINMLIGSGAFERIVLLSGSEKPGTVLQYGRVIRNDKISGGINGSIDYSIDWN
ncbi:MAG: ATPase, T2SS/T4P/T4SS family [Oscillospiraceae bacterium]